MPITILGIDPGFASTGWALVGLSPSGIPKVLDMGTIRTEKATKKQNVLASNDNFRRAKELTKEIGSLLYDKNPPGSPIPYSLRIQAVCAESMSFPRNASTAAKMAMCWGVVAALCEEEQVPMFMATPKELKKAVCGKADASKEEVQAALKAQFGDAPDTLLEAAGIPPSQREHPYDALAAVVACMSNETLRLMWRAASCAG